MARMSFQLPNTQRPTQGPCGIPVPFDFTTRDVVTGDLTLEQASGTIEYVQSIFIDNRFNAKAFVIVFGGLQYTIQCKAGRQGLFPVITATGSLQFTATSIGSGIVVPTIMMNVEQNYFTWDV